MLSYIFLSYFSFFNAHAKASPVSKPLVNFPSKTLVNILYDKNIFLLIAFLTTP